MPDASQRLKNAITSEAVAAQARRRDIAKARALEHGIACSLITDASIRLPGRRRSTGTKS